MTTITREEKIALFRKIYTQKVKGDAYVKVLPYEISRAIFDNEYSNSQGMINDMLCDTIFGKDIESINWFIYDWQPGYKVESNDKTFVINNLDDYIAFIESEEGFGE
jgi:hypothetical protein